MAKFEGDIIALIENVAEEFTLLQWVTAADDTQRAPSWGPLPLTHCLPTHPPPPPSAPLPNHHIHSMPLCARALPRTPATVCPHTHPCTGQG